MKISLRDKIISRWNIILFLRDKLIYPWNMIIYPWDMKSHMAQERAEGPKAPSPMCKKGRDIKKPCKR
jgi:hypothetical protein